MTDPWKRVSQFAACPLRSLCAWSSKNVICKAWPSGLPRENPFAPPHSHIPQLLPPCCLGRSTALRLTVGSAESDGRTCCRRSDFRASPQLRQLQISNVLISKGTEKHPGSSEIYREDIGEYCALPRTVRLFGECPSFAHLQHPQIFLFSNSYRETRTSSRLAQLMSSCSSHSDIFKKKKRHEVARNKWVHSAKLSYSPDLEERVKTKLSPLCFFDVFYDKKNKCRY